MNTNDDSSLPETLDPTAPNPIEALNPTKALNPSEVLPTKALNPTEIHGVASQQPRIRFGLIIWGLIVSAFAVATLAIVAVPVRRDQFTHWITTLEPGSIVLLSIVALGVLILLLTLVALAHKLQRPRHPSID